MYGATAGGRRGKDLYNMDIITPELQAKPISIRKLEMKTNFSRRELQTIYQGFKRVCPTGYATKETFTQVYASFFPSRSSSAYAQMCFRVFDKDGAGKLSFEQFACCLSRIMRGTDLDKIDWIFALYDQNGDGYITRTEVTEVATAIFDLVRHKPDKDPQAVESRVNTMFQTYDLDHDGKISKEEFVSVSTKDPQFLENLKSFGTEL
ncbi:unnamed protein product [Calicophoron daubneyi]|uniref:EF-hand domain-containing protein n=1 Tax=Calicophoron daubneyi TaxID=300641 RepID=A0AAV2TLH7_CALDB